MRLYDEEITDERWIELIEEQKESSLPILDWCDAHRISFKAFNNAKKRLLDKNNKDYVINCVNGIELHVYSEAKASTLLNVINVINKL